MLIFPICPAELHSKKVKFLIKLKLMSYLWMIMDPAVLHLVPVRQLTLNFLKSSTMLSVQKFKRRNRYLEFLVQVVQKAISEGFSELAIEWCEDALTWITRFTSISKIYRCFFRRNEAVTQVDVL